jgi:predicted O-linked N-acetylglucosamine transferase (SPINDLY family)
VGGKSFGVDDGRSAPAAVQNDGRPVTIGYLIANAAGRGDAPWLADILSRRRGDSFVAVGFGYGPLSTPSNLVFQKCVDRWQDVSGADAFTFAAMVRAENVDILVDLAGLEAPALHAAFASRMAPCQVAWLGTPSLGLAGFDAVLTDRFAGHTGGGAAQVCPTSLRLGSVLVPPPAFVARPPREQGGEILLMADAALSELNAVTVERWSAILHAAPEAKLVLRDRGLTQADALKRVLDIFGTFGVAHRVDVIAEASPAAFFAHGDIALLPYPCPSPASLGEALSAGLPVVCPAGEAPWSRAAASVLDHLGVAADTVAEDGDAYVALALRWAGSPGGRAAFRARLEEAAHNSRVWDAAARDEDFAAALGAVWAEVAGGAQPLARAAQA